MLTMILAHQKAMEMSKQCKKITENCRIMKEVFEFAAYQLVYSTQFFLNILGMKRAW